MAELTSVDLGIVGLTGAELIDIWIRYIDDEIDTHEKDIQRNTGKVIELKELKVRMQGTCLQCGKFMYSYGDHDRMAEHMEEFHPELA